jgi:hypothetical protein
MFHAFDDPYVPYQSVAKFAGVRLKSLKRGEHLRTEWIVQKYWAQIGKFFEGQ